MTISIIVAVSENGVIGRDNQLIWRLPSDLKNFKHLTTNHPIIMGRKTFESIGKPLPNRTSIIITRNNDFKYEGCTVVTDVERAIDAAVQTGTDEVFVIGGAEIYKLFLPIINKIYLTEVKACFEGDTFFQISNPAEWQEVNRVNYSADEKHAHDFDIVEMIRK